MRMRLFFCGALAASCVALMGWRPQTAHAEDAIAIYSAGLDGMLVDKKDMVLRDALRMLGDRLLELPNELDDQSIPAPLIKMALEMLGSPMSFRMGMLEDANGEHQGPPVYGQLLIGASDAETTQRRADTILSMMPFEAAQVPGMPGVQMFDADGAPLYMGTADINGRSMFIAALNEPDLQPPKFNGVALPAGVTPTFAMKIDVEPLLPLIDMMINEAPSHERDMIRTQLAMMGVSAEHPLKIDIAAGHGTDRSHGVMRFGGYATNPNYAAMLSHETITPADLRMIPADATFAEVWKANMGALPEMLRSVMQQNMQNLEDIPIEGLEDPIGMLSNLLEVDLEEGIFNHLGDTGGYYMSDTTGGGGLFSMVMYQSLTNPKAVQKTLADCAASINGKASDPTRGYVNIREREAGGHQITSLMFPGLPVPLEISWTVSDGQLWMGLTPQAVVSAINHVRQRGESIVENPRFRELAPASFDGVMSFSFTDYPSMMSNGYGLACLGASALSNAMRSPSDPSREPGLILPPYHDLTEGAKGSFTLTRIIGDDMVIEFQSDRSALVGLTAVAGMVGGSVNTLAVGALGLGVMLPAVASAREQAEITISQSNLRNLATAIATYAAEHNDALPPNAQALVDVGYIDEAMMISPFGPAPGEGFDFWLLTAGTYEAYAQFEYPSTFIAGYDRAMLAHHHMVNVLFVDGHVESIESWRFYEMTSEERYEGIDFNLPDGW